MKINERIPRIVGYFTLLVGLFNVLSNTIRKFRSPTKIIDHYFFVYLNSTAFAAAIFTGLLLIVVSRGLFLRKQRALRVAIFIILINLTSELFRFHFHPVQILLNSLLLLLLIFSRGQFIAKSDPTTRFRPLIAFVISFSFFLFIGTFLYYFRHSSGIVGSPSLLSIVLTVLRGFLWIQGPVHLKSDLMQDTVDVTLGAFGVLTILLPIAAYLRRVSSIPLSSEEDKEHAIELINKFGDEDSLAFFATRDDKSIIWSRTGQAGIAYRIENGVMLASGDPIGEFSLWPDAIKAFLEKAREYGWTPAVMGASERGGKIWIQEANLAAIELGDEAIINVADFSLEGRPMSKVRQTINKARREGFTAEATLVSAMTDQEKSQVVRLAKQWRGNSVERGFSMSMDRFFGELDNNALFVRGTQNGELVGFLYFVPWGKVGYSLDRMQRAPKSLPGLTELMIEETIEFCRRESKSQISLNFAAFRSVIERSEKISAGPVLRLVRTIIRISSAWFQVESLYRFTSKFQPEWKTRYLLYPGINSFASVVWASLRAEKFVQIFRR